MGILVVGHWPTSGHMLYKKFEQKVEGSIRLRMTMRIT